MDHMHLMDHFMAYAGSAVANKNLKTQSARAARNYPVVCLNYHKIWFNLPAVMLALGLPPEVANSFPRRKEKVRTGGADRHGGGGSDATSEVLREALRMMYKPIVDEISNLPAVFVE